MGRLFKKDTSPRVASTKQGNIQGVHQHSCNVFTFRGIPYALPPIGSLRFRRPQPHPIWEGIRDCTKFGPRSVQGFLPLLFLTFVPHWVAIFIYTGLYITGNAPFQSNDPEKPLGLGKSVDENCLTLNIETPTMDT